MTEIQQTKEDIAVLREKLEKLEELQRTKSPIEKAFYRVYGEYPPTTPSVSNSEDERWSNFQKGYNASKEECKVEEEPKPTSELNKNSFFFYFMKKTGGLHDPALLTKTIELLKEWLPDENDFIVEERDLGWNDAIRTIKQKIR